MYALHEKVLLFTHALARRAGKTVAVWYDTRNHSIKRAAVDSCAGPHQARTALVNLIRNGGIKREGFICLSSPPGEIDRGIFQMNPCEDGLYWMEAAVVKRATSARFGWSVANPAVSAELHTWAGKAAVTRDAEAADWCARNTLGVPAKFTAAAGAATSSSVATMAGGLVREGLAPMLEEPPESAAIAGYAPNDLTDAILLDLAYAIVRVNWSEGREERGTTTLSDGGPVGGHNVGCVMVDGNGTILGWGVNMSNAAVTIHGEINALLNYQRRHAGALPAGTRFYTTLKPCHMCAGTIVTAGSGVTVIVGQDDVNITGSALDRRVNGCSQISLREATGPALTGIQGRQSTTGSLATDGARDLLEEALYRYFLHGISPLTAMPLEVWQRGYDLLKRINPHVDTIHGFWLRGMREAAAAEAAAAAAATAAAATPAATPVAAATATATATAAVAARALPGPPPVISTTPPGSGTSPAVASATGTGSTSTPTSATAAAATVRVAVARLSPAARRRLRHKALQAVTGGGSTSSGGR